MEIVPFTPEDQQATADFMRQVYREMNWKKHPLIGAEDLEYFFHLPDDGAFFLIKDKEKVVGTGGWVKLADNDALLKRFFIAKEARGSGVATLLFQQLIDSAKEHKITRFLIDVSKNNPRAIHFFEKNGFRQYNEPPIEGWDESKMPEIFSFYFLPL